MTVTTMAGVEPAPQPRPERRPGPTTVVGPEFHRAVDAFQSVARAASTPSVTLEDLLRLTGEQLCRLLGMSRCSVYLRRRDGRFQGRVGYCTSQANIDSTASRRVTGRDRFTAEIVDTASPIVVVDASQDSRTVQRMMRQWRVKDVVGVPLVVDGEVIGIIYADDQGQPHTFTDADMTLATTFANLSAYVVQQAWSQQQASARANAAEQERHHLARVASVRAAAAEALSADVDLRAALQRVADLLGQPVVRYDRDLRPTCWVLPAGAPERMTGIRPALSGADLLHPDVPQAVAKLRRGAGHVVLRTTPERRCRRLLVRLAREDREEGYLELCEMGGPFQPSDAAVLEEVAALLLFTAAVEESARPRQRDAAAVLDRLVRGADDAGTDRDLVVAAGIDPDLRHAALLLGPSGDDGAVTAAAAAGVADRLDTASGSHVWGVGHVEAGDRVVLVLEIAEPWGRTELRDAVQAALEDGDGAVPVVVSDVVARVDQLKGAVERAHEVAELVERRPVRHELGPVFAEDFELMRLASGGGGVGGAERAAQLVLAPLVGYDREHGGNLLSTLRAFIECGAQYRATASRLAVHENTVRYRLHRVAEVAGIDPASFHDLSRAAFALQVDRLQGVVRPARECAADAACES